MSYSNPLDPGPAVVVPQEQNTAVLVTRRQLVWAGAVVGVGLAICLLGVVAIALRINTLQQDAIDRNAQNIVDNQNQLNRLDRLTATLADLNNPTPKELRLRIRRTIRRCLADRLCAAELDRGVQGSAGQEALLTPQQKRLRHQIQRQQHTTGSPSTGLGAQATPGASTGGGSSGGGGGSTGGGGSGGGGGSHQGPPGPQDPPGAPGPAATPPPDHPAPLVNPTIPIVPPVCVDGIAGINCK